MLVFLYNKKLLLKTIKPSTFQKPSTIKSLSLVVFSTWTNKEHCPNFCHQVIITMVGFQQLDYEKTASPQAPQTIDHPISQ